MSEENKYKDHPYESDYSLLKLIFDSFEEQHRKDSLVLMGYKGAVNGITFDELSWERRRIKELKEYILKFHYDNLIKLNESSKENTTGE